VTADVGGLRKGYEGDLPLFGPHDAMKVRSVRLRKRRPSPKLFSDFNTLQFASVMGMVLFALLLMFMTIPVYEHRVSVDLPHAMHASSMPGALREDVMQVSVTRDGKVYFGTDQIGSEIELSNKIRDRLRDRGVERKVYISADLRARWGAVKQAADAVRSAGILRVAFLVNQRTL
jgi:biopolymer transport protein TolR